MWKRNQRISLLQSCRDWEIQPGRVISLTVGGHFGDVVGALSLHGSEARMKPNSWLFHVYQISKPGIETIVECVGEIVVGLCCRRWVSISSSLINQTHKRCHLQFSENVAGKVVLYSLISVWNACISTSRTGFAVVTTASSIRSKICCNFTNCIKQRSLAISAFDSNSSACFSTYDIRVIMRSFCNIVERLHTPILSQ